MASGFQPPMLIWSSDNLSDAFRSFEQYCSLIFEGPFSAKTEKEKVTYLLLWIGHHGLDVYDSFQWDDDTDGISSCLCGRNLRIISNRRSTCGSRDTHCNSASKHNTSLWTNSFRVAGRKLLNANSLGKPKQKPS